MIFRLALAARAIRCLQLVFRLIDAHFLKSFFNLSSFVISVLALETIKPAKTAVSLLRISLSPSRIFISRVFFFTESAQTSRIGAAFFNSLKYFLFAPF